MYPPAVVFGKLWRGNGGNGGVRSHAFGFALWLLFVAALRADDTLAHSRQAQALLGPDVWSRAIRIENSARHGPYPRTLHALVFELEGVLWFYTDTDGTQSFSLHRGRLAEEEADFGPLLRDIEPGFTRWSTVPAATIAAREPRGSLPNGCFIKSVAAARALGGEVHHRQVLAYYVSTPSGLRGHAVLTYETRGRLEVLDPEQPHHTQQFSETLGHEALTLARALSGGKVMSARLFPLDTFGLPASRYATAGPAGGNPEPARS